MTRTPLPDLHWCRLLAGCRKLSRCIFSLVWPVTLIIYYYCVLPEDARTGGSRHPPNKPHQEGAPHGRASQVLCLLGVWTVRQSPFEFAANIEVWFSGFPTRVPPDVVSFGAAHTWANVAVPSTWVVIDGEIPCIVVGHGLQSSLYSSLSRTLFPLSNLTFHLWPQVRLIPLFSRDLKNDR